MSEFVSSPIGTGDAPVPSTAEQVKQKAQERLDKARAADAGELLTLPSGLVFRVRRPSPEWFALDGYMPQTLAAKLMGRDLPSGTRRDPEETIRAWRHVVALLRESVIEPRIGFGAGEIAPNLIGDEDTKILLAYARGEVKSDAASQPKSLDTFLESDNLLLLAQTAKEFGTRPSSLLAMTAPNDAMVALQIDLAAAVRLWQYEAAVQEEIRRARGE